MNEKGPAAPACGHYELRFRSLRNRGCCLAFPCNDRGSVDMDTLENSTLQRYLYARAVIGFEFSAPAVFAMPH